MSMNSHLPFCSADGDGLVEMAVTYSDRVVRTFRWQVAAEHEAWSSLPFAGRLQLVDKWQLAGQVGCSHTDLRFLLF